MTNYYVLELGQWVKDKDSMQTIQIVIISLFTVISLAIIMPIYMLVI